MARQRAPETGGEVLERTRRKTRPPSLFKVVLHNDDYTTMEFVVRVLENVFSKSTPEAFRIMLQVHVQGRGICGSYTWEIAETKVTTVHELARSEGYPLRASMEEE
jgi:ATP-dependent Clp protease adaptor protein ClpS